MKHFSDYSDYMRQKRKEELQYPGRSSKPCRDELIIEENTIYEIDSSCYHCLQRKAEENNIPR